MTLNKEDDKPNGRIAVKEGWVMPGCNPPNPPKPKFKDRDFLGMMI